MHLQASLDVLVMAHIEMNNCLKCVRWISSFKGILCLSLFRAKKVLKMRAEDFFIC